MHHDIAELLLLRVEGPKAHGEHVPLKPGQTVGNLFNGHLRPSHARVVSKAQNEDFLHNFKYNQ